MSSAHVDFELYFIYTASLTRRFQPRSLYVFALTNHSFHNEVFSPIPIDLLRLITYAC